MRAVLVAAIAALVAVVDLAPAEAVERPCPEGQIWDLNRGACVKKKKARRRSPEEKYYAALEHLEGRARRPDPAKGVALLREACAARHGAACTQLGFVHLHGRGGVAVDGKQALVHYDQGCALGDLDGCVGAADVHGSGVLGAIDHAAATQFLARACDGKSGRACHRLAQRHEQALGVAEDKARAQALYRDAMTLLEAECGKGVGASCDLVGLMYRDGSGVDADWKKAATLFEQGCTARAGDACYHLGGLVGAGMGVAKDPRRAYQLHEKACVDYDHGDACFEAGRMLAVDEVAGDARGLERLAQRACELGPSTCHLLGFIRQHGKGVAADAAGAIGAYRTACDAGNGVACQWAGDLLLAGSGGAADPRGALTLWEKGCELGDGRSCVHAGRLHWQGDDAAGIAQAQARGYELFHQGCLRNDTFACEWGGVVLKDGTDGTGVAKPDTALLYFEHQCSLGGGAGCGFAGDLHRDGKLSTGVDVARAVELYDLGCGAVEPTAHGCRQVAHYRREGTDVPKDLLAVARALTVACRVEGETCMDADAALKEAGAGADDQAALRAAIEEGCGRGLEVACASYALLQRHGGHAVAKDLKDSARRLGASCERGYLHGCFLWAAVYEYGLGIAPDKEQAKAVYKRACDGGYHEGCFGLSNLLAGEGADADAMRVWYQSCEAGHASSCNSLGFYYYTAKGVRWDIAEATRLYEKGCELGDAVACSNVAEMYEYGITRERDAGKAYALYQKACEMGFQGACGRAAWYLERGEAGAAKDAAKAEALYEAGCNIDMPDACQRLADLLEGNGKGTPSRIAQLRQRAFDSARQQAATNPFYKWMLGTFHRDGVATVKDAKAAAALFVEACAGYDPLGCLDAGRLYVDGAEGLAPDRELAAVQLDKACAANVAEACKLAQTARTGGATPGTVQAKGSGCACNGGGGATGAALAALVLLALGRQRRRA